jgi:hypothetical protein
MDRMIGSPVCDGRSGAEPTTPPQDPRQTADSKSKLLHVGAERATRLSPFRWVPGRCFAENWLVATVEIVEASGPPGAVSLSVRCVLSASRSR